MKQYWISLLLLTALMFSCRFVTREPDKDQGDSVNETSEGKTPAEFPVLHGVKIIIWKNARRLELWRDDKCLHEFPCGFGFAPKGHKQKEGDGKTPEGRYRLCEKNAASKSYKAMALSYPNADDARAALADGRISREQYDKILQADENGLVPPWDTGLGGDICIHAGHPDKNSTLGCIALKRAHVDIIFDTAQIGTPIWVMK